MLNYFFAGVKALFISWLLLLILSAKTNKPEYGITDLTLQVSFPVWVVLVMFDNRKSIANGKGKK